MYLDSDTGRAAQRQARLNDRAGGPPDSDAAAFAGSAAELADLMTDWLSAGVTGFRLRPAAIPADLLQITRALVPELQKRATFRKEYEASTLRGLLGLARPASRYAAADSRQRRSLA